MLRLLVYCNQRPQSKDSHLSVGLICHDTWRGHDRAHKGKKVVEDQGAWKGSSCFGGCGNVAGIMKQKRSQRSKKGGGEGL